MITVNEQLQAFTTMHDEFLADWNEAMRTGDTASVERMADDYYVAFFNGASEKPTYYSKEEAVAGMKQSVQHLLGAEKKFENRVIRMKDHENAVVFYELLIQKNEKTVARLFSMEIWQLIDGKWLIAREIEQPVH